MKVLLVHNEHIACFAESRLVLYLKRILNGCSDKLILYTDAWPEDAEYDVVVIVGNVHGCIEPLRKKLPGNIPAIFFATGGSEGIHIPRLRNISRVFFIDRFPVEYVDFPKELSDVTHFPGYAISNKKRNAGTRNIAFIGDNTGLYPCKQVIAVFNELEGLGLRMFVREEHIAVLKEYANENILFENLHRYPDYLDRIDLAITNGQPAVDAVLNEIPAIIVGDYGFGGLVTMRNVQAHIKQSFSGRMGGTKGERIPVEMIMTELEWAGKRLLQEPGFTRSLTAVVRETYEEGRIAKIITGQLCETILLHRNIYDNANNFLQMIPVLAGNVAMQKNDTTGILRRLGSMRTIMELHEGELFFMGLINGQRSIAALLAALGSTIDAADVLSFIRNLWEEKIIYFKQVN